jgi:tRNA-dihydrouridine synthase B
LIVHGECFLPAVPSIVQQPLLLGQVPIPSRFFLAPLAGYTSLAYRLAVRECGGLGLATTDLVNARSLLEQHRRALELSETCESDRPLSIQLYGSVIPEMQQAARWVEQKGATAVDINMGCPVRKVVRTGGGSALMCQMDRAVDLVGAIVAAVKVPVTVKMRLGWDDESLTAPDLARAFEQAGVAGVIIHGRTREQGFKGSVNRAGIRAVVEAVDRIPVVANGDIRTIADAAGMLSETGCAGISVGRGALANPWIFRQLVQWEETGRYDPPGNFEERLVLFKRQLGYLAESRGMGSAIVMFRKTAHWYLKAMRVPSWLRNRFQTANTAEEIDAALREIELHGPIGGDRTGTLPDLAIPVPSGPVERW